MAISVEVNIFMNKRLQWRLYIGEVDGQGMAMGIFMHLCQTDDSYTN